MNLFSRLFTVFLAGLAARDHLGAAGPPLVLEANRLHLGKPGQWEWEEFKDLPVDAERLELRFQAKAHATEQSLRIWQSGVKLDWRVLLNGKAIGGLVTAESAMEILLPVPAGVLKDGENVLTVEAPAVLDDIRIGPIALLPEPVQRILGEARVEVSVSDSAHGKALPCRLTLTKQDGTLQPLLAEPAGGVAVRTGVCYTGAGKASLSLPAGDYVLHATRGFEWSAARTALHLRAGGNAPVTLQLTREVPTEGWIAADSHIHTVTHSGHGDATLADRVLTIAGEGIELAIATDHNHHTDLIPAAASRGLLDLFTPLVGNEITTKHGHFNAFPIVPGAPVPAFRHDTWAALLPGIRATPGVKVITLNHPRDVHSGFTPLGESQFNAATGAHVQATAMDIDAMEVITSAAMQSDIHLLYRDWFAMLNRGHRMAAIGSSDSHDVNRYILGQGRTYVAGPDAAPAQLDLDKVWESYHKGRLLVSMGLLTHLKVDDRFTVGDLATGLPETFMVEAVVLGPSWVQADHIALYANGLMIREQVIVDPHRPGEKARVAWRIPRPKHDVHLVVIATGPGVTAPFWEIPRPYQASSKTFIPRVIGSTNPIWLDADGDGKFQSAYQYARTLVGKHGADSVKLPPVLDGYDQAVAVQVQSLLTLRPD